MSFAITKTTGTTFQPTMEPASSINKADAANPLRRGPLVERTPTFADLSATDLEVIYQATGVRLNESSKTAPLLAFDIARDRELGRLQPGQPIDATYLTELLDTYSRSNIQDVPGQIHRALDYLAQRGGAPGVDLNA